MTKTVLTVDDSRSIREMMRISLEPLGYKVLEAQDGKDGLEKLGADPVDIVITDLNMPGMNGIEFIKEVRKDPRYAGLPLVMLTTEAQADLMRAGKKAGASGWLVKPFNDLQLELTVRKFIG